RHETRYCEIPAGGASSQDQNVNRASAKLQIESTPPGADVEVDGSFVGSTPSDVQVAEGDHTVVVKKSGFKNWERKLKAARAAACTLAPNWRRLITRRSWSVRRAGAPGSPHKKQKGSTGVLPCLPSSSRS